MTLFPMEQAFLNYIQSICRDYRVDALYVLRKAGDLAYFERQRRSQILSEAIS